MIDCFTQLTALGYLGPGGALSAIGVIIAAAAGIAIALIGFVWYPVRRLIRARAQDNEVEPGQAE